MAPLKLCAQGRYRNTSPMLASSSSYFAFSIFVLYYFWFDVMATFKRAGACTHQQWIRGERSTSDKLFRHYVNWLYDYLYEVFTPLSISIIPMAPRIPMREERM